MTYSNVSTSASTDEDSFLYFAFGSNLLASRIRINSPSAKLVGAARLPRHKLGFSGWSQNWQGGVANIFPSSYSIPTASEAYNDPVVDIREGEEGIWGAVWSISNQHLSCLDKQEGVDVEEYEPVLVEVELFESVAYSVPMSFDEDDSVLLKKFSEKIDSFPETSEAPQKPKVVAVRSYRKVRNSSYSAHNEILALPSDSYKLVILKGAIESGLPLHYVRMLSSLTTNRKVALFSGWKQ